MFIEKYFSLLLLPNCVDRKRSILPVMVVEENETTSFLSPLEKKNKLN
jgi:hypothetical protein